MELPVLHAVPGRDGRRSVKLPRVLRRQARGEAEHQLVPDQARARPADRRRRRAEGAGRDQGAACHVRARVRVRVRTRLWGRRSGQRAWFLGTGWWGEKRTASSRTATGARSRPSSGGARATSRGPTLALLTCRCPSPRSPSSDGGEKDGKRRGKRGERQRGKGVEKEGEGRGKERDGPAPCPAYPLFSFRPALRILCCARSAGIRPALLLSVKRYLRVP